MAPSLARSKLESTRRLTPIERCLYMVALDLDPRIDYTNYEIQVAWRRRIARVHHAVGGNDVISAINTAYVALVSQPELFQHVDLML